MALTMTLLGGVTGQVIATDTDAAGKNKVFQNGPTRTLRLVAFDGAGWNESLCIAAEKAMQMEALSVLAGGSGTLLNHCSLLTLLIPALASDAVMKDVATASALINTKISLASAIPVLVTILGNHGILPSGLTSLLPAISNLVAGLNK